jgi:uncharacterized protein YegJ (DUF2314 family)
MSRRAYSRVAVLLLAFGLAYWNGFSLPVEGADTGDKTVSVSRYDSAMNAAIEKARDTLPVFWNKRAKPEPDEENFSVKLGISDGNNTEHFWCGEIQGDASEATCVINNEPVTVFTVKIGQRVNIDPAIVSDWMYMKNGKIKGGQTIRALIPSLPEEEAQSYRAMLADE